MTPESIIDEISRKIVDKTLPLVSLPSLIVEITNIVNNDHKGIKEIVGVIQKDLSLSTRLISIANSPVLRTSSEIVTLTQAVSRLGMLMVRNLALCVSLRDKMVSGNVKHKEEIIRLLAVSNKVAEYNQLLCKSMAPALNSDTAYLIGLLSNIGEIVTLRYISDRHKELTQAEVERVLTLARRIVTRLVLIRWDVPSLIVDSLSCAEYENQQPITYCDINKMSINYLNGCEEGQAALILGQSEVLNQENTPDHR